MDYHFSFEHLSGFEETCLTCKVEDYRLNTIIFNTFIFCQVFNEYNARKFEESNMFDGMTYEGSKVFFFVTIFTAGMQIILVEFAADFVKTSPLTAVQWLVTVALGAGSLIIAVLMRFIPVQEDPNSFYNHADFSSLTLTKGVYCL